MYLYMYKDILCCICISIVNIALTCVIGDFLAAKLFTIKLKTSHNSDLINLVILNFHYF